MLLLRKHVRCRMRWPRLGSCRSHFLQQWSCQHHLFPRHCVWHSFAYREDDRGNLKILLFLNVSEEERKDSPLLRRDLGSKAPCPVEEEHRPWVCETCEGLTLMLRSFSQPHSPLLSISPRSVLPGHRTRG